MLRARIWVLTVTIVLALAAAVALPAAAQPTAGTFLTYSRFQVDDDYDSEVRVTNTHESEEVDVAITFVCEGASGVCESLTTTVSLQPGETRVLDVASLNLPCGQGFAVGHAVNTDGEPIAFDYLTGTYEVSIAGKGKRREADVAVTFVSDLIKLIDNPLLISLGVPRGERLMSDFRTISLPDRKDVRRQGSYLNLADLSVEAGASNSESTVTIDWWTEDGDTSFSTTYRFTCFGRVRLDEINANLLEENHGSAVGWMRVRARGDSLLVGSISEFGKGSASVRNMFDATPQNGGMGRRITSGR